MINMIEKRDTLKAAVADSQQKLAALSEALNNAKSATKLFMMEYDKDYRETEQGLAQLDALTVKESSLQAQYDTEKGVFDSLTLELNSFVMTFSKQDLGDQYQQIDAAKERVNALTAALEQARQKSETTPALVDTVTPLKTELQACLVSAALGVDVEKDIARLEKALANAVTNDTTANKATLTASKRLADTLAGLESGLDDERLNLSNLERSKATIEHELLIDKAKELSSEYADHLQQAIATLFKLMALDAIIDSKSGNKGSKSGELLQTNWLLTIPVTPAMKSNNAYADVQHFLSTNRHNLRLGNATAAINTDLTDIGIRS